MSPFPTAKLRNLVGRAAESAWFAFTTIFLLQLKVIWGMWEYRDLTFGDTSSYFLTAYQWFQNGRTVISWSPLYTSFYGYMLYFSPDAYVATTAHRIFIVLVLSVLVLAVMRKLLPGPLAWVVTAWWVVLPINFNSLYEVHLFAVIPLLIAYLIILYRPGPGTRGAALGVIVGSALLMRNELILAAGLLAAVILAYEIWQVKTNVAADYSWIKYLRSYGLPLAIACLLTLFFYSRANDKIPMLFESMSAKHTLNICQVYAFGYQQRHPEWTHSPWTECESLMTTTFGKAQLTLSEAVMRNPRAIVGHFLWNISLIPNGLQVLLFNATSGLVNPDYAPVNANSSYALVFSFLLAAVYLTGLYKIHREWRYWWTGWLESRVWGWIAMACPVVMIFFVMTTQRPRPSYLFSFGLFMMTAAGFCADVIFHRWAFYRYLFRIFPILVVLTVVLFPSYYHPPSPLDTNSLARFYRTLVPFQEILRTPGTVLLTAGYPSELCSYLGLGSQNCNAVTYWDLRSQVKTDTDWLPVLSKYNVNIFYADESILDDPQSPKFLSDPGKYGWEVIGYQNGAKRKWLLLQRPPLGNAKQAVVKMTSEGKANVAVADAPEEKGNLAIIRDGDYGQESYRNVTFRWLGKSVAVEVPMLRDVACVKFEAFGAATDAKAKAVKIEGGEGSPVLFDLSSTSFDNRKPVAVTLRGRGDSTVFLFIAQMPEIQFPNDSRRVAWGITQPITVDPGKACAK